MIQTVRGSFHFYVSSPKTLLIDTSAGSSVATIIEGGASGTLFFAFNLTVVYTSYFCNIFALRC